jgi:hypothetical protein
MKIGIIDRFEDDLAVIEIEGTTINVPRDRLPDAAQPGDVVQIQVDQFTMDEAMTEGRKQEINKLMDELWED